MSKKIAEYGDVKILDGKPFKFYETKIEKLNPKDEILKDILFAGITSDNKDKLPFNMLKSVKDAEKQDQYKLLLANLYKEPFFENFYTRSNIAEENEKFANDLFNYLKREGISKAKDISTAVLMDMIGFGELSPLLMDDNIEEIMVDAPDQVFIFHREHGACLSNITFESKARISRLIKRIGQLNNKDVTDSTPFIDAHLIDGSRVNATLPIGTPDGPSITIRKFRANPHSIIDLIKENVLDLQVAAFLWIFVEGFGIHPLNMLVIGGTGSGKTTMLNILTNFIPRSQRIVSIEDTLELKIPHLNKIRMEANVIGDGKEVALDDLLKNSLRMRPDRIILGEVRGKEAITLFTAMDTGHRGVIGTLHANTSREALIRLKTFPMDVPEIMFPLIDLVIVMGKRTENGKLKRKIVEIGEVVRAETGVAIGVLYKWNPVDGELKEEAKFSQKVETICEKVGISLNEFNAAVEERAHVLSEMVTRDFSYKQIQETIDEYYNSKK